MKNNKTPVKLKDVKDGELFTTSKYSKTEHKVIKKIDNAVTYTSTKSEISGFDPTGNKIVYINKK